jgi:serine/threonine-protein kinase PknK
VLIATKLRGPTDIGQWVPRDRLLAEIGARHRGRRCRACLIAATTGFGKTTLAAQLGEQLTRAGDAVSWLSLDPDDDNAERLCKYVLAAVHRAQPKVDPDLASLLDGRAPDAPSRVATAIINAVAAEPERITVILDDCQNITDPGARELLRFLIARSPDNLHFVLTTRPPAPLPLGALRAHDEITEIDAAALRFDGNESETLLNHLSRLGLDAASVRALCDRTEGWPAALRLASISLRGRAERSAAAVIAGFSGGTRAITDYLCEDVLDRLDERWARFLLETSVLDRMCAEVCDAVTGELGSQELLDRTEAASLFLIGLDDERKWFRYHHLFVDFLRRRVAASPHLSVRVHLAAATWFADQGLIEEAVGHALSAGAPDRALAVIERDAMLLVQQSRMSTLLALVGKLHADVTADRPALQVSVAWAKCLIGATDESDAVLGMLAVRDPAVAAEIDLVRGINAGLREDVAHAETFLARAMPALPADAWLQGVAANLRSFVELRHNRFAAARDAVVQGRLHQERARGAFSAVYGRCLEGLAYAETGELASATRCFERGLDIAVREVGRHGYATRMASAFLGELRYEQGDLAAAGELLDSAFSLRDESGLVNMMIATYVGLAHLHETRGDHDAALAVVYEGARHAEAQGLDQLAAAVMHTEVRLHLAAGNLELAARRCADEPELVPHQEHAWELRRLARARLLVAQGRTEAATQILEGLRDFAQRDGRRRIELVVRLVAAQSTGDRAELVAALALGEAQGAIRSIVDEGPVLHAMLRKLPPSSYVTRLLAAARPAATVEPRSSLIEPLNVRELQILRLVEQGMLNKDISTALGISLDTVKWHLKNAYQKLGVATRTGAVHAARAAGALGAKSGPKLARR